MHEERELKKAILDLLARRGPGKTVCPSEVARAVAGSDVRAQWEPLMEPVRAAADALVREGRVDVTQRGQVVDRETARGPLRLRLR
jgi:hypothetical protein